MGELELSMDARVLLAAWFSMGNHTSVDVGGRDAVSRLTARGKAAINELVAKGYATAEPIEGKGGGRMRFVGTDRVHEAGVKLSRAAMERHGRWSATEPNRHD